MARWRDWSGVHRERHASNSNSRSEGAARGSGAASRVLVDELRGCGKQKCTGLLADLGDDLCAVGSGKELHATARGRRTRVALRVLARLRRGRAELEAALHHAAAELVARQRLEVARQLWVQT